jgi:geranylgeranylglycerol-phosphate geranylgeranyltransferase
VAPLSAGPKKGRGRLSAQLALWRPFTLLPPLLGILSGAICAYGSAHNPDPARRISGAVLFTVLLGSLCASAMNAASNIVNQIADLEIDRENKPGRPMVTGEVTERSAWAVAALLYVFSLVPTWFVVPYPRTSFHDRLAAPLLEHACFFIYAAGMLATFIYSFPAFGRSKRHWFWANFTIAATRGCLLKVAGWSFLARVNAWEVWTIGSLFGLYLLGATSTKDFSDMKGDARHGCITLPVRFGVAGAARIMAPFFVLPWLALSLVTFAHDPSSPSGYLLTGNRPVLFGLGLALAAWGAYAASLLVRDPEALATTENHPAWRHMYLLLMSAQIGFAAAYLV